MPAVNTWGPVNSWQSVTAATITAVSSPRGADIAAADDTLTITVDDSTGINSVTVNSAAATAVTIVDATTVTATAPHGFNAAYGSTGDVVVNNGVADSAGYPVTLLPPTGMVETAFTVDYANLDPASPFAGDAAFSAIVAGDSCIYDAQTTPDGSTVTMDGVGVFTLSTEPAADQAFDYYIHDQSDHSDGPVGTITVQARVVGAIGIATDAGVALPVSGGPVVSGTIGVAVESGAALPVADGSPVVGAIGIAVEAGQALGVTDGSSVVGTIGIAAETGQALPVSGGAVVAGAIGAAQEAGAALPVTGGPVIAGTIGIAAAIEQALPVSDASPVVGGIGLAVESGEALPVGVGGIVLPSKLTVSDSYTYLSTS